jgi:ribosomal protein L11 methyltransferase
MEYIEVNFEIDPSLPEKEMLVAWLTRLGFDGFMESETGVLAYIPKESFIKSDIHDLAFSQIFEGQLKYSIKTIKEQNWNEQWEDSYPPVTIKEQVHVRAPFHPARNDIAYEIIVEPKMSFGTAHHETTSLMVELMIDEDMEGKHVLDVGCGTGILAILAEKLGAAKVDAIDIDEWAYRNALDNVSKNKCKNISVQLCDVESLNDIKYEYILANINRNVLLMELENYATHLKNSGILLVSGFYSEDLSIIESAAMDVHLKLIRNLSENNWIAARFLKN